MTSLDRATPCSTRSSWPTASATNTGTGGRCRSPHVNDPVPSRLPLLRFLQRVQERDLAATLRWITDEERRGAEQQLGVQTRPPAPEWLIGAGLNRQGPPLYVHVGDCWNAGRHSRDISREQARRAHRRGQGLLPAEPFPTSSLYCSSAC
ncbi:DUF6233 domain-containing protein [Streptomyces populi]|nr:DUF6233 domain-containing protein [Streptomyces populi]